MTKLHRVFMILVYSCLLGLTLFNPWNKQTVVAQEFPTLTPSLLDIGCGDPAEICIYDNNRSTKFFVFVESSNELWIYSAPDWTGTMLDMSTSRNVLGTSYVLDFVSLSETELLFIGTRREDGKNHLTIVDVRTGQFREPQLDLHEIFLDTCDSIPSRPNDSLWVFPDSSRVIVCGIEHTGMRQLVIADMGTSKVVQIIRVPARRDNGALNPWFKILVGQDGNVYVVSLSWNAYEHIFPNLVRPENAIDVSRYSPSTGTWNAINIPLSGLMTEFQTGQTRLTGSDELVAVDVNGNLYYWSSVTRQNGDYVRLMTIFNSTGEVTTQLPVDTVNNAGIFIFQAANGKLVFQNFSSSPLQLCEIDPAHYLPQLVTHCDPTTPALRPSPRHPRQAQPV